MKTRFEPSYQPPFPQLAITLRDEESRVGPIMSLLDTGADVTLIPMPYLGQLGAMAGEPARIRSHLGDTQLLRHFVVDIQVGDLVFSGIYAVGYAGSDEIILGRDVLNRLALFLDGPAEQTQMLDDRTIQHLRALPAD